MNGEMKKGANERVDEGVRGPAVLPDGDRAAVAVGAGWGCLYWEVRKASQSRAGLEGGQ